jgi:hypothetical protein
MADKEITQKKPIGIIDQTIELSDSKLKIFLNKNVKKI